MTVQVPVVDGLFVDGPRGPRLIGSRCDGCGHHYFPASGDCRNPACTDRRVKQVELGPSGILWSYSVQHYMPPPPFRVEMPFRAYAIGLVELPDNGIKVLGMIKVDDPRELVIGAPVELVLDRLYTDHDGNDVVTYKFRPAADSRDGGRAR